MISLEVVGWDDDPKPNMCENIFDAPDKTRGNDEFFRKTKEKKKNNALFNQKVFLLQPIRCAINHIRYPIDKCFQQPSCDRVGQCSIFASPYFCVWYYGL